MGKQLQRRENEVLITSLDTVPLVVQSSQIKATTNLETVVSGDSQPTRGQAHTGLYMRVLGSTHTQTHA